MVRLLNLFVYLYIYFVGVLYSSIVCYELYNW